LKLNLTSKIVEIKAEEEGLITPNVINPHSNELANFSSSNVLDVLNNLLYSRNSLPCQDDKKITFEHNPQSLVLLNVFFYSILFNFAFLCFALGINLILLI